MWLLSFGMMFLRFTHTVACVSASLLFMAESYSIVWIDHISFIHLSTDRQLGCFLLLAMGNRADGLNFACLHIVCEESHSTRSSAFGF